LSSVAQLAKNEYFCVSKNIKEQNTFCLPQNLNIFVPSRRDFMRFVVREAKVSQIANVFHSAYFRIVQVGQIDLY